jgi:hypothetical protein
MLSCIFPPFKEKRMCRINLAVYNGDRDLALKAAINAFLAGKLSYLAEIKHRESLAIARRKAFYVVKR